MHNSGPTSYSQKAESRTPHSRVLVGISGGIYSAVTAALLKTQGHEVIGLHVETKVAAAVAASQNHCVQGNSKALAQKVAAKLGIDLQVVDASELYNMHVVEELIHATARGQLPNPCIACTRDVKLATLFSKAKDLRCEKVATGHAAQVVHDQRHGLFHLMQGGDPQRDQSYFLFSLGQSELSRLLLPLGNFPKSMVARLGAEHGLDAIIQDAQSICYLSGMDATGMRAFYESKIPVSLRPRGVIRTGDNQVLGEHQGFYRYRIGERPQLQNPTQETESLIVVGMEISDNALILGTPENLKKKECIVTRCTWLRNLNELQGTRCMVRFTPAGELYPCHLTFFENLTVHLELDERCGPVFPGQAIVFYQENEVLGGGWIRSTS